MKIRSPLLSLVSLAGTALVVACEPAPVAETPRPEVSVSGHYDVKGVTVAAGSTAKRRISGSVVLVQDGGRYTASFDLKTTYPSEGVDVDADVIGTGEGTIEGDTLSGRAQTQLVIAAVPGIDTGFAFIPRTVTTRLVSTSVARLEPNGSISIEIENVPAPGQTYAPTHTRLAGRRVGEAGRPNVAALE